MRAVRLTNDYIARTHGRSNMFATLFFGILEPATGSLFYVNGGHLAAALLDAIESAVLAHAAGWEQADDITLLAVRRE